MSRQLKQLHSDIYIKSNSKMKKKGGIEVRGMRGEGERKERWEKREVGEMKQGGYEHC